MRIAVTGATGVLGRAAVHSLVSAGHEVRGSHRDRPGAEQLRSLGAEPLRADVLDADSLTRLFRDCDAVVNLATHVPIGYAAARPGAWRANDRIRTRGVGNVVAAAREAGVRRVVQESVSFVYADGGEDWVDEQHPIDITPATEPVAMAEARVQDWSGGPRVGVVLRFGTVVGDDAMTRFQLRAARRGRAIGVGRPESWAHVVHTDDLGPAVAAALHAPAGVYNVGAEPVRRGDLVAGFAEAAGVDHADFLGPVLRRLAGARLEPLTRSLRICSDHFAASTGWAATRARFSADWLGAVGGREVQGTAR